MKSVEKLLNAALNEGTASGIEFVEARWGDYRRQYLSARDQIISTMVDESSQGMNVRVFHRGVWGFAAGIARNERDVILLVRRAREVADASALISGKPMQLAPLDACVCTWESPVKVNPFDVPLKEKLDLLLQINGTTAAIPMVQESNAFMRFQRMRKIYVNSIGSRIDQTMLLSDADFTVTAVGNERCETRDYQSIAQSAGYETIDAGRLLAEAPRVAREAVDQLTAKAWDSDTADLILMPCHTRLVIHETIGHATELDRILGWEADYAGTSFATPEKLNRYRYGSDLFSVTADRTRSGGLATCSYDDEGIPAGEWKIVKNGILTGYSTTRDTAPLIGAAASCGCAYADNWKSFPILRMANIGIDPGPENGPTFHQLVEDTDNGILVEGMDAFSIDHQRINFQFSGDYCRRIRNGRIEEPLWNVVYNGANPSFWSSMDAVCRPAEWRPYGVFGCAKGQPVQITALTHGSAPLRLRNVGIRRNS